jgi:hypothetical protein
VNERIYYENSNGERINLQKWPYILTDAELYNYAWDYDSSDNGIDGGFVTRFRAGVKEVKLELAIYAPTELAFNDAFNAFYEAVEVDVLNKTPGRLVFGEYYYIGYIAVNEMQSWSRMAKTTVHGLTLVSPKPFWCRDVAYSFDPDADGADQAEREWLNYPYSYPYNYSPSGSVRILSNDFVKGAHGCNFSMKIYGSVATPRIMIAGNLYIVHATVYPNEYIVINSRDQTVVKRGAGGSEQNLYNARDKENNVFRRIPTGTWAVQSNAKFDLTIYQERSRPKWIL